jgi:hypothetical protein
MPNDFTDFTYWILIVLSTYGIGLFGYEMFWKMKHGGKPSSIFVAVFFLFVATLYNIIIDMYVRGMIETGSNHRMMLDSVTWASRKWPTIAALGYILITLTKRLFVNGIHQHRVEDGSGVCRGVGDLIVHSMNGAMIYYRCSRCGKEWKFGDSGYDKAKSESKHRGDK